MRDPATLALARRVVSEYGSVGVVAAKIGRARPTLSRYLNDPDYESPLPLEERIRAAFDKRECPHTGQEIAAESCRKRVSVPRSCGNPVAAAHWDACQQCHHKPHKEESCNPQ